MSVNCRNISDGAIKATISLNEDKFIKSMIAAGKSDRYGMWGETVCHLVEAERIASDIFALKSECDISIHEFVNENIPEL